MAHANEDDGAAWCDRFLGEPDEVAEALGSAAAERRGELDFHSDDPSEDDTDRAELTCGYGDVEMTITVFPPNPANSDPPRLDEHGISILPSGFYMRSADSGPLVEFSPRFLEYMADRLGVELPDGQRG